MAIRKYMSWTLPHAGPGPHALAATPGAAVICVFIKPYAARAIA